MKEGEPELGGLQVPHKDTTLSTPTPDAQPAVSVAQQTPSVTQAPAAAQPATQLISQTFAPNNTAGRGGQLNNLASQSPTPRPTPTFQQPQQLPTQSTPLTYSGTVFSDLVSKKSKKWLIISITAAIILIFIAITIFFIVNNQTTNKKLAEDSFENFIGYLTNGNENNNRNSLLDFNANNFYAIDKFYYDRASEESANYFRQLSGYWQNYIQYTQITEEKEIYTTTISNGLSVVAYMLTNT